MLFTAARVTFQNPHVIIFLLNLNSSMSPCSLQDKAHTLSRGTQAIHSGPITCHDRLPIPVTFQPHSLHLLLMLPPLPGVTPTYSWDLFTLTCYLTASAQPCLPWLPVFLCLPLGTACPSVRSRTFISVSLQVCTSHGPDRVFYPYFNS